MPESNAIVARHIGGEIEVDPPWSCRYRRLRASRRQAVLASILVPLRTRPVNLFGLVVIRRIFLARVRLMKAAFADQPVDWSGDGSLGCGWSLPTPNHHSWFWGCLRPPGLAGLSSCLCRLRACVDATCGAPQWAGTWAALPEEIPILWSPCLRNTSQQPGKLLSLVAHSIGDACRSCLLLVVSAWDGRLRAVPVFKGFPPCL